MGCFVTAAVKREVRSCRQDEEVLCGSEWRRTEVGIYRCDSQRAATTKRGRGGEVVKMERLRGEEEDLVPLFKITFLFLQMPIKYTS
jgi:hypothetical protein